MISLGKRSGILIWVWMLVLSIIGGGCTAEKQPTSLVYPSEIPSLVAESVTSTPSLTPTEVRTATPFSSPTPVPTQVATRNTQDADGSGSINLVRPTFTLAPATQTATFAPALVGLSVEYFITNTDRVSPGDNVTLFWRVIGAEDVSIFSVDAAGTRTRFWEVNTEGRLTVATEPSADEFARFVLEATRGESEIQQALNIPADCPFLWFFTPPPEGCPTGPAQASFQVEQRFEQGSMIWLESTDSIYVLYGDDQNPAWEVYVDNFEAGIPERDETLSPPAGRFQPIRGFGLVWRETPTVQDRLGWAVETEVGYDGLTQGDAANTDEQILYLRTRDGNIVSLEPDGVAWTPLTVTGAPELPPADFQESTETPDSNG